MASWCSNYAFEDVIRAVDDVDVIELEPAPRFELRQQLARSVAWHGRYRAFQSLNPGVKPVRLQHDYDAFGFECMNVWDLLYLNAVVDWQSRCKVKICYMAEIYAEQTTALRHLVGRLEDFDQSFQCFAGSVEPIGKIAGRPCHYLPYAVDVLQFTPYSKPPTKPRANQAWRISSNI